MRNFIYKIATKIGDTMASPKNPGVLTFFKRKDGTIGWNLRAANGEIVLPGEGHATVSDCVRAIRTGFTLMRDPNLRTRDLTQYPHVEPGDDKPPTYG